MADADRLLSELDRQLSEQRSHADALASRAGVLLAIMAILAALLSSALQRQAISPSGLMFGLIALGSAFGITVLLLGRIVLGLSPVQLASKKAEIDDEDFVDAKLLALEANARALTRTDLAFLGQVVVTVGAVVYLAVLVTGGQP